MGSPLHEHLAFPHWDGDCMRRCDGATELELHDAEHHARVHEIVTAIPELDGPGVLRRCAKTAFAHALAQALDGLDVGERCAVAEAYYAYLGLGTVWLDTIVSGELHAPTSHVARAWSRRGGPRGRVCALTEGFLEAAVEAIVGRGAEVRELACAADDAPRCRFAIVWSGETVVTPPRRLHPHTHARTSLTGDVEGLIRDGELELAHVPAGLYVHTLADWLALAGQRGAPVLAHALTHLDQVSAPETPLRVL